MRDIEYFMWQSKVKDKMESMGFIYNDENYYDIQQSIASNLYDELFY